MAIFRQKDCAPAPKILSAMRWVILAALCLTTSCAQVSSPVRLLELPDRPTGNEVRKLSGDISEVAPPAIFLDLANLASDLQPQVAIAQPKPNQTLTETKFTAKIKLSGLSIYREEKTQLGPHLKVILDNQPAQDIYNLDDPIEFSELLPGSHTLRTFAVLPWGESFKNPAAFAQTTFHILAPTSENTPDPSLPLLTYNEPQGTFSSQPVLLDFYLNNAPLHLVAAESKEDDIQDWQIRCTVNGQSFLFDQWQPTYLKGLKPGQNWVQLSLVDEQGKSIDNAFNSTVRLVNYDIETKDTLSKLVRGELPIEQIGQIVIPDYEPPAEPLPDLEPTEEAVETVEPVEETDELLLAPVDSADVEKREVGSEILPSTEEEPLPLPDRLDGADSSDDIDSLDGVENFEEKDSLEEIESFEKTKELEAANSLEETEREGGATESIREDLPEELSAPAAETEIDFSSEPEDTSFDESETFESLEEGTVELESSEATLLDPKVSETGSTGTESSKAESSKAEPLTKTGFLEQLKTKWSAFQKAQIESQSETIQPAKAPISPSIQLYTNADDPREDAENSDDSNEPADAAESAEAEAIDTANPTALELR